ncbi:3149_t:CDS:2 [Scutellospora calospora]|uniref:3149_t:CDS:1 n=1 Tax=Scutellospora calospora TaxID=85575 RepID=A0ACA9KHX8_9GLOM|nr:3149_t:CDS:2 [Scutellospora calospora]
MLNSIHEENGITVSVLEGLFKSYHKRTKRKVVSNRRKLLVDLPNSPNFIPKSEALKLKNGVQHSKARSKHIDPNFFGPGAKPGHVPTDVDQATGLERAELLAALEGKDLFESKPLQITKLGTKKEPTLVKSVDPIRYVGCTGFPVDSHELLWIVLDKSHEFDRCPECGHVYKMNFVGTEGHGHGHH